MEAVELKSKPRFSNSFELDLSRLSRDLNSKVALLDVVADMELILLLVHGIAVWMGMQNYGLGVIPLVFMAPLFLAWQACTTFFQTISPARILVIFIIMVLLPHCPPKLCYDLNCEPLALFAHSKFNFML